MPVGKEMIRYDDEEGEWEDTEGQVARQVLFSVFSQVPVFYLFQQARPGTTKRKQYYTKRISRALCGHVTAGRSCHLYFFNMRLVRPITEEQNTRGRPLHAPEASSRGFALLSQHRIPLVGSRHIFL